MEAMILIHAILCLEIHHEVSLMTARNVLIIVKFKLGQTQTEN